MILFFYADWCRVSTLLKGVLETLAKEYGGKFRLGVVPSELPGLEEKKKEYKSRERPHVFLLRSGHVVGEFSGGLPRHKVE